MGPLAQQRSLSAGTWRSICQCCEMGGPGATRPLARCRHAALWLSRSRAWLGQSPPNPIELQRRTHFHDAVVHLPIAAYGWWAYRFRRRVDALLIDQPGGPRGGPAFE